MRLLAALLPVVFLLLAPPPAEAARTLFGAAPAEAARTHSGAEPAAAAPSPPLRLAQASRGARTTGHSISYGSRRLGPDARNRKRRSSRSTGAQTRRSLPPQPALLPGAGITRGARRVQPPRPAPQPVARAAPVPVPVPQPVARPAPPPRPAPSRSTALLLGGFAISAALLRYLLI
ncbi:hypothetical protein [Paralimibaculum aggregatum]|nr:hypothetical protein [Limibaculum sp. NKW23]